MHQRVAQECKKSFIGDKVIVTRVLYSASDISRRLSES